MQIEIKEEETSELINALNNSIIALNNIKYAFFLCCIDNLSEQWQIFFKNHNNDYDECTKILDKRLKLLYNLYNQLTSMKNS